MSDFAVQLPHGRKDYSDAAYARRKILVTGAGVEVYQPGETDEKIALELEAIFDRGRENRMDSLTLLFERKDLIKLCRRLLHYLDTPLEEQILQTLEQIQGQLEHKEG